jgi:hypothetical protein
MLEVLYYNRFLNFVLMFWHASVLSEPALSGRYLRAVWVFHILNPIKQVLGTYTAGRTEVKFNLLQLDWNFRCSNFIKSCIMISNSCRTAFVWKDYSHFTSLVRLYKVLNISMTLRNKTWIIPSRDSVFFPILFAAVLPAVRLLP